MEKEIAGAIQKHGGAVLRSDVFRNARNETHHLRGTLEDHILNVSIVSAQISRFCRKNGIRIHEEKLIRAALCHDLGMVGRNRKYRSLTDSWKGHAKESARVARHMFSDLNDSTEASILTHMWPVSGKRPRSREGLILNIADKYASAVEWITRFTGNPYKKRIKQMLRTERISSARREAES